MLNGYSHLSCQYWAEIASVSGKHGITVLLWFGLFRVKAAQSELGTQILADFEEAFPSQGSKVFICFYCS